MSEVVERTAEETAALETTEAAAGLAAGWKKASGQPLAEKTEPAKTEVTDEAAVTAAKDAKKADEAAAKAAAEEAERAREKAYLESLPASVRQKLDKIDRLDKIEATANQIGATQRKLKAVEDRVEGISKAGTEAAKAATAAGAEAPTQAQIDAAAAAGGEKWKRIKEDFPDWAEAMDERLAALNPGTQAPVDVDALRKEVAGDVETKIAQSADTAEERAFIRLKHPGWKATVNTPEFKGWYEKQPEEVKTLAASNNGDDAVKMLDAFEEHRKAAAAAAAKQQKQTTRLEAAIAPKGSGAPPPPTNNDADAFRRGWNKAGGKPR